MIWTRVYISGNKRMTISKDHKQDSESLKSNSKTHHEHKNAEIEVDPALLEILVCPLTKTTLVYDKKRNELISKAAKLAFPIKKGIPIMLIDLARPLDHK